MLEAEVSCVDSQTPASRVYIVIFISANVLGFHYLYTLTVCDDDRNLKCYYIKLVSSKFFHNSDVRLCVCVDENGLKRHRFAMLKYWLTDIQCSVVDGVYRHYGKVRLSVQSQHSISRRYLHKRSCIHKMLDFISRSCIRKCYRIVSNTQVILYL